MILVCDKIQSALLPTPKNCLPQDKFCNEPGPPETKRINTICQLQCNKGFFCTREYFDAKIAGTLIE